MGWTGEESVLLVLSTWLVILFAGLRLARWGLMRKWPIEYGRLTIDKQRATDFQVVEGVTEVFFLFFCGVLLAKRHIVGDYPDTFGVQGERVFALYLLAVHIVELFYRQSIRLPMLVHHIVTLVNISLAISFQSMWSRTYIYFLGLIGWFMCLTSPQCFTFVAYRLFPLHERTYHMVQAVALQEGFSKIVLHALNLALLISAVMPGGDYANMPAWRYVIVFGSFILFIPAQFYTTYVLSVLWRKIYRYRRTATVVPLPQVAV